MTDGAPLRAEPGDPLFPRSGRRRVRHGGFETVRLNAAGWSALVGAGLALGVVVALATPLPVAVALPAGAFVTWAGLVAADHVRWRNGTIGMGFGGLDAGTGAAIVAELEAMGIAARYEERTFDEEDGAQRSIVYRNADAEKVETVVRRLLGDTR